MNLQQAIETVIRHLDKKMEEAPDRETADLSNALEELLEEAWSGESRQGQVAREIVQVMRETAKERDEQ